MRITTNSLQDFKGNLDGNTIALGRVFVDRVDRAETDHTKVAVLQASAIVELDDNAQALVQLGMECGVDEHGIADAVKDGSERRNLLYADLKRFCEENGLRLLPGILDT